MPLRLLPFGLIALLGGCLHVKMDPIEIHATVNVRVDRAVNTLLADIYGDSATVNVPPPAAQ